MSLEEAAGKARHAAHRLHHLSMLYSGSLVELLKGEDVGILPANHPGLKQVRDFIDLILFTRAEINALAGLLIESGMLDTEQVQNRFAEEYEWFAQQKAKLYGCEVEDYGLRFTKEEADRRSKGTN